VTLVGSFQQELFWFVILLIGWVVGTTIVLFQAQPSLAFLAVQAWMALNVVNGAVMAVRDGATTIGQYDFTDGIAGGMRICALAQVGLVIGVVGFRVLRPARRVGVVDEAVPAGMMDRWACTLLAAGAASLLAYVFLAGSGLGAVNVLTGGNVYGGLKQNADGAVVGYLKVLTGLAGVAMMLASLRITVARQMRLATPICVLIAASVVLITSGGRSWLGVPVVGCGLAWYKMTRSSWALRPRRLVLCGGLVIFAVAAIVGGLRGQAGEKNFDAEAFVAKELRGGIFPTTAGLAESVPEDQPFLLGRSALDATTLAVPRALWPEKPAGALQELQDGFMPEDIGASFGFQGELYANVGLAGVLIGAALFAALVEWCWLRLMEATRLSAVLWFAALVPLLIHVFSRGYTVMMLAGQLGTIGGVAVVAHLLNRHARPGSSRGPDPRTVQSSLTANSGEAAAVHERSPT